MIMAMRATKSKMAPPLILVSMKRRIGDLKRSLFILGSVN